MRAFADVLGIEPSRVRESATVLQAGRGLERIRICWFALRNLIVELIQQISGNEPYNDFLDTVWAGIAHIGMDVHPDWRVWPPPRPYIGPQLGPRPDAPLSTAV